MIDASVHVTRWGTTGPKIVMIHGGAQGSSVGGDRHFSAQARLAERGWQVLVPDRPGHGRSPAPGRPDDPEADGEWIAELLGEGAHLVGHSFGAACALNAAFRRPQAVHSLTLIEPAMQMLAKRDPRVRKFVIKLLMTRLFSISATARAKGFARLVRIPPEMQEGSNPEERARVGKALTRIKIPTEATLEKQLTEIARRAIPLLVVTGGWSPNFTAVGDTVAAHGNGRHVIIQSPHHFPQLISEEFNNLLDDFMRAADAKRG